MTTACALRFASGRFHATPWGRHHNEGVQEWPPSPWRLLRALVAVWRRDLRDHPLLTEASMRDLLTALAAPPRFVLPPAAPGHTRHYLPLAKPEEEKIDGKWVKRFQIQRTKVFDTFVALDRAAEVVVLWPEVALDEAQCAALDLLLTHLGYLGRAESWCLSRLLSPAEAAVAAGKINCAPLGVDLTRRGDGSPLLVDLLCADPATAFRNDAKPTHTETSGKGKQKKIVTPLYDPDWNLCMETLEMHDKRYSDPPGARWVSYRRSDDALSVKPQRRPVATRTDGRRITMARYALDGTVLPLRTETLVLADMARRACMGIFGRQNQTDDGDKGRSHIFAGKDDDGAPLSGHWHAYYLPSDEDGDGRLDHLTIMADDGFGPAEVRALNALRSLKQQEGEPLNLLLLALGDRDTLRLDAFAGPARVWCSATPFLATRHQKTNGAKKDPPHLLGVEHQRDFALHVLREELERLRLRTPELPEVVRVEALPEHRIVSGGEGSGGHGLLPLQFKRFRPKRGDDGGTRASGAFRIVFAADVAGPLRLGHHSHFGMGLFLPAPDRDERTGPE